MKENESSSNQKIQPMEKLTEYQIKRKYAEELLFPDLCLLLAEIVETDWKDILTKYHNVGWRGLFGAIIAEIKMRKIAGDKLRKTSRQLARKVQELSQGELFDTMKNDS